MDQLLAVFEDEFSQMRSWYDLAREKRGRTTASTSASGVEKLIDTVTGFVRTGSIVGGADEIAQSTALRIAVEDLKAYYFEAVSIQPGQPTDSKPLAEWFWGQTAAAKVIGKIREICKVSDDAFKHTTNSLVPKTQLYRFE